MSHLIPITIKDVSIRAGVVAKRIAAMLKPGQKDVILFGVPRGGIAASLAVGIALRATFGISAEFTSDPSLANFVIDDLEDSGATRKRFEHSHPGEMFQTLLKKIDAETWYVFPWELSADGEDLSKEDIIIRQLQAIGEDPNRGGLAETPARVVKAWAERFGGYGQDPAAVLKTFKDGAEGTDQMVLVSNIPIYSKCEHHLEDIFGVAHIAYIPDGKVVGLSKLARIADIFARRAQVQERLTNQIADALQNNLNPQGVGVVLECRHMCMESRGARTPGTTTITSALRGAMKDDPATRAEFLAFTRSQPRSPIL